jgi:hypothetical protein
MLNSEEPQRFRGVRRGCAQQAGTQGEQASQQAPGIVKPVAHQAAFGANWSKASSALAAYITLGPAPM